VAARSSPANLVSVREYAVLCTHKVGTSLDSAEVSESAFDHLCRLNERFSKAGARLLQAEGRHSLKLDNFVGVVRTPCGTTLEIVPKHVSEGGNLAEARTLLRKMLAAVFDLPTRDVGTASVQVFDAPLSEWVMQQFLRELDYLVKRGLRSDYQRIEEELPFLRGQLNTSAQSRQRPGQGHRFHVRHDAYLPDRPENRLLKLALERVHHSTGAPESWRLAQELTLRMQEVPRSRQVSQDFEAWGEDRLMTHYRAVKPWCELILNQHTPLAIAGSVDGMSLLFPMEKLFERYVARWLRSKLPRSVEMRTPARLHSLCQHVGKPIFGLEPDIYIADGEQRWVLDTKWKLLNASKRDGNYDISRGDFFQLYAYGQKYLGGAGRMALVYPSSSKLPGPLPHFSFDESLHLEVLAFDLEGDAMHGIDRLQLPTT